ncbi:MAG: diaminopimelate dehydrogenase [Clostridia bacterium]|nr:diaminopimelate dehydrogenase [Clostridia bacterium]
MKIGIYGYGNLGRGVELAASQNEDVEVVGVFTRRDPSGVVTALGTPVYRADEVSRFKEDIDVMIICGGSATDLPVMTPEIAKDFSLVDSFDTHPKIPEHFAAVDAAAKSAGTLALISAGWDPGMFSLARIYSSSILPCGESYTFWGKGVSQGHSDAVRRIKGVVDARQYTVPREEALEAVRSGANPELTAREKHLRECYVVAEDGADLERIEREIKTMPDYFADYDTTVTFIDAEEMKRSHSALPHGGFVIRSGKTGCDGENAHTIEYKLTLASNPEFTAGVLVAAARAVCRMRGRGETGCVTLFDVAPRDLSPLSPEELRAQML